MSLCKCVINEFMIEHNDQFFPKPPYPGNSFPGFMARKWVVNYSHFGFSDTASLKNNLDNPHTDTSEVPPPPPSWHVPVLNRAFASSGCRRNIRFEILITTEYTLHQRTDSQAGERQRVGGWCAAQPWESAPSAQVTSWLTPVLPDASPRRCALAVQASAGELHCCHHLQKGHSNKILGRDKGGCGTEVPLDWGSGISLSDSVSPSTWVQKEFDLTSPSCFHSRASWREESFYLVGLVGLDHALVSPTTSWDMWGKRVANGIPCKQYRERHLLHSPKTRRTCTKVPFGAFVPVCA